MRTAAGSSRWTWRVARRRVVRVEVEEACPAPPDAEHLVAGVIGAGHERLDARVQTRNVTTAREDREAHAARLTSAVTPSTIAYGRSGGIGRRAGLKIPCPSGRVGSTPTSGIVVPQRSQAAEGRLCRRETAGALCAKVQGEARGDGSPRGQSPVSSGRVGRPISGIGGRGHRRREPRLTVAQVEQRILARHWRSRLSRQISGGQVDCEKRAADASGC